jgi:hypothetical protein
MTMRVEVAWRRPDEITDDQLEALGVDLPGFPAVIDDGQLYLYARFDVDEANLGHALEQARVIAAAAHGRAFGVQADPVQLAIAPADPGLIPGPLDLVGITDVGAMLGVTRQRASQLTARLSAPLGHPSGAPTWVRSAVAVVTSSWDRRPGHRIGTTG